MCNSYIRKNIKFFIYKKKMEKYFSSLISSLNLILVFFQIFFFLFSVMCHIHTNIEFFNMITKISAENCHIFISIFSLLDLNSVSVSVSSWRVKSTFVITSLINLRCLITLILPSEVVTSLCVVLEGFKNCKKKVFIKSYPVSSK